MRYPLGDVVVISIALISNTIGDEYLEHLGKYYHGVNVR